MAVLHLNTPKTKKDFLKRDETMPDFEIEAKAKQKGYKVICGVDEAGRGPLAGPVCAAAVVLPEDCVIDGLNDSKKLTEKKRELLYDIITEKAIAYSISIGTVGEIEEYNILNATFMAMNRSINECIEQCGADFAVIDGNRVPTGIKIPCITVIKGDSKSCSVAAASILAKVTRDRLMIEYAKEYPEYQFEKHKGYGTALHYQMIKKYGVSKIHRLSFLKNLSEK